MNKRKYVFVIFVNILILNFVSAGIGNRGYAHHHRNYGKHSPTKLKEVGGEINYEKIEENKEIPESPDEAIEGDSADPDSGNNSGDLDSEELANDDNAEAEDVPERLLKRHQEIHGVPLSQGRILKSKLHKVPIDNEGKLGDEPEEEDSNNDEDYVQQIPYDPEMPGSIKLNERTKRLISGQEEESKNVNDDTESEKENVKNSDIEDKDIDELSSESTKVQQLLRRNSEKAALSKKSPTDSNATNLVSKIADLNSELQSTAFKTAAILSAPKAAVNSAKASTNGPSQAFKNLVELNKAYKMLLCASNKFVKVANKTLMDRMLEECATKNVPTTTDTCKTTTTTESYGGDCCLKGNSLIGTTGKSGGSKEELDDSLVDELLDITMRPRKKQGQRQNKELLSWIQSHGNYDSLPSMNILPAQDDHSIYVYGDYGIGETAEEDEEQGHGTENVRRISSSAPSDKDSGQENESSSTKPLKPRRKHMMSKVVVAKKVQSSSGTRVPGPSTSDQLNPDEEGTADKEDSAIASPQEKQATARNHVPKNYYKHFRRLKYNKKFPQISFAQTRGPGIKDNEEAAFLEDLRNNLGENGDESNILPKPED